MSVSFQEILRSRQFKFLVGAEADGTEAEYSIYEEAIAQLSEPLQKMMKGGVFAESKAGCTTWKEVKKETFERFIQFAYMGDYSIPKPATRTKDAFRVDTLSKISSIKSIKVDDNGGMTKVLTPPPESLRESPVEEYPVEEYPVEEHPMEAPPMEEYPMEEYPMEEYPVPDDPWGPFRTLRKDKKKKKKERIQDIHTVLNVPALAENFHELKYPLRAPRNTYAEDCEPEDEFFQQLSYSNVFLSHASLYVLGDLWLIDCLKALALFKLHKTLCVFELDDTNIGDVLDLARCAYRDEGKGCEEGIGNLRNLVCQYMASNAIVLSTDDGFIGLLKEGGDFVADLWRFEVQRQH